MTGIDYPKISVGEHVDLTVRFSLAAQVLMRRRGIDPAKIQQLCSPFVAGTEEPNLAAVQNVVTVFSAMVAENFLDQSRPHSVNLDVAPSADYWATQIPDLSEVERVIYAALGKAAEARRKRLAVAPPLEAAS